MAAALGVLAAAALFFLWYASLYTGDNLGTRYEWQSPPPEAPVNLAFGRPTRMSSHTPGYPYLYNSRHAVDGGRGIDSCFFTDLEEDPWWQVDLQQVRRVGKILLYTGFGGERFNASPLAVSISDDGRLWRQVHLGMPVPDKVLEIRLELPEKFRYLNIRASGRCVLSLNEVEVYEPEVESVSGG